MLKNWEQLEKNLLVDETARRQCEGEAVRLSVWLQQWINVISEGRADAVGSLNVEGKLFQYSVEEVIS